MKIITNLSKSHKVIIGITVLFFLIFNVQAFFNHYLFRSDALDYGFSLQALRNFCNFRSGPLTIFHLTLDSYFQIHPSFTLLILSPFACLLKPIFGSYTLLLIMNLLLSIGGYYTYKVVLLKTKDEWLSVLAGVHYFVIWGHFSAITKEYVDPTVSATVMPVFLYYFLKKKYWISLLFMFFIITSRENMPLWFFFVGLFLIVETYQNKRSRHWSIAISVISLLYLIIVFKVLIPAFHVEGSNYQYNRFQYSALGNNINEALLYSITHPVDVIRLMFDNHLNNPMYDGIKIEFWNVFLLCGGFLLYKRVHYILLFIPIISQKMLGDMFIYWGIDGFSSIEVVSILSLSIFIIISTFKNKKIGKYLGVFLCVVTLSVTIVKMNTRVSLWYQKNKEKIYDKDFYKTSYNIAEIKNILSLIPKDAKVCATSTLVPHLSFRDKIYYFPYINDAEYLVFLIDGPPYPLYKDEFLQKINEYENSNEWEIVDKNKDVLLLKRIR